MNILSLCVIVTFLSQLNIIFGAGHLEDERTRESIAINQELIHLISWFDESGAVKLLQTKEAEQISAETLATVISQAAWDELEQAIEGLLKHPKCKLEYLQGFYAGYKESFWGETKTKTMLKQKIIELGGKDPDSTDSWDDDPTDLEEYSSTN